ncbi:biological adhesion [Mactra antiquata]
MENLCLVVLIVISLQTGFISCNNRISAERKEADLINLINRLEEFEKRELDRERERKLMKIEMKELQIKVQSLEKENDILKRDIAQMKDSVNDNKIDPEKYENDLVTLKTDIEPKHNEVKDSSKPDTMEITRNGLSDIKQDRTFGSRRNPTNRINKRNNDASGGYKTRIENGVRQANGADTEQGVAFYATLTNHLTHIGVNQNIVFDKVYTNVGNAYNVYSGDFRAPVSGLYVFSTTLLAYASHTTQYHIVKNGSQVGNLYLHGSGSPHMTDSLTIVLYLNVGDDVAIKNLYADESLNGYEYCTFSGFLLQRDTILTNIVG